MAFNGKRLAYTAVITEDGYRLGIAVEGEVGYHQAKDESDAGGTFPTYEAATQMAEAFNGRLGLSAEDAFKIVMSTMFGPGRQGR